MYIYLHCNLVFPYSPQVASTSVFVGCGVLYLALGVFGKLSAVFISIPNPVLGGSLITMMGMFVGVTLSNLRPVSLTSTRNLAIIGTSIMLGLIIPEYMKKYGSDIDTGKVQISFSTYNNCDIWQIITWDFLIFKNVTVY